jgi:hypothetical protein
VAKVRLDDRGPVPVLRVVEIRFHAPIRLRGMITQKPKHGDIFNFVFTQFILNSLLKIT